VLPMFEGMQKAYMLNYVTNLHHFFKHSDTSVIISCSQQLMVIVQCQHQNTLQSMAKKTIH